MSSDLDENPKPLPKGKAKKRLVPATKEKPCTICGAIYVYPSKGSTATRHKCEVCVDLSVPAAKSMKRLNDRIRALELKLSKIEN